MIIKIDISGKSVELAPFPTSWSEVNSKTWQTLLMLRSACSLVTLPEEEWPNPLEEKKKLIASNYLLARKALIKLYPQYSYAFYPEVVNAILEESMWLADLPGHHKSFRSRIGWWFGPKEKLYDWTWYRFGLAEENFKLYIEALQDEDRQAARRQMNRLFACLYGVFGIWNNKIADWYIQLAFFVRRSKKHEAIENYRGLREWLQQTYKPAFSGGSSDSNEDLMRSLTIAMAGPKFGNVPQVLKANLHDVLIYQCQIIEESQR